MFRFKCAVCDEWHEGIPGFGADAPVYYYHIPKEERATRCELTSDTCVIDDNYFIRGCIEIPVLGTDEPFIWGVWVSLSAKNFAEYTKLLDVRERAHFEPYFGWLSTEMKVYPETVNLKTMVCPRDDGIRPYVELEPNNHPLATEQRNGITPERVAEIYAAYMH